MFSKISISNAKHFKPEPLQMNHKTHSDQINYRYKGNHLVFIDILLTNFPGNQSFITISKTIIRNAYELSSSIQFDWIRFCRSIRNRCLHPSSLCTIKPNITVHIIDQSISLNALTGDKDTSLSKRTEIISYLIILFCDYLLVYIKANEYFFVCVFV